MAVMCYAGWPGKAGKGKGPGKDKGKGPGKNKGQGPGKDGKSWQLEKGKAKFGKGGRSYAWQQPSASTAGVAQLLAQLLLQQSASSSSSTQAPPSNLELMLQSFMAASTEGEDDEDYWWGTETETETDTGMAEADDDHSGSWVPQEPLIPEPQALCALFVELTTMLKQTTSCCSFVSNKCFDSKLYFVKPIVADVLV